MSDVLDISRDIVARSDQLNADDLMGGPVTVQILGVRRRGDDKRLAVEIAGHQPWMPCKTMLRVLGDCWTLNSKNWIGRFATLYRDPEVTFGGEKVGGIRVAALSHIPQDWRGSLLIGKGKKGELRVRRLLITPEMVRAAGVEAMRRGWTSDEVRACLGGSAEQVPEEKRASVVVELARPPARKGA